MQKNVFISKIFTVMYSKDDNLLVLFSHLSHIWLSVAPWTAACQAPPSSTISQSLLKFMSIESVMLSNHLILCHSLLLLLSIFPSIGVFPSESALCIRWPKYWSFSFSPSNEYSGLAYFALKSTLYTVHVTTQTSELLF